MSTPYEPPRLLWKPERLKPCPFCGSSAVVIDDWPTTFGGRVLYGAGCANQSCLAYTGYGTMLFDTADEAITRWNRRMSE